MAASQQGTIPTVDLQSTTAAQDILHAASTLGFVFVKNYDHRLKSHEIDHLFDVSRSLFAAPRHVKEECAINSSKSGKNRGWLSVRSENLDPAKSKKGDFKEGFNLGEFVNGKAQQPLPAPLVSSEDTLANFFQACHALCNDILRLFAIAMKIDESEGGAEWFAARHQQGSESPSGSVLRLLYYPALPADQQTDGVQDIRAGAHSDYGSITLLFRLPSQPGLEILTENDSWQPVPVHPDPDSTSEHPPILVNIGDLLSYWTNGLLRSTVHRVVFPNAGEGPKGGEDRYSIAYFCHPQDEARLEPIPSEYVRQSGAALAQSVHPGDIMTARDHLNSRLAATYSIAKAS